jgi:hypothetical protein
LRQVLILHNGNGDTPGLSFEELTGRLDRSSRDLIAPEKAAIRNLRRLPVGKLIVEALRKTDKFHLPRFLRLGRTSLCGHMAITEHAIAFPQDLVALLPRPCVCPEN